jgi:hypothetical protein
MATVHAQSEAQDSSLPGLPGTPQAPKTDNAVREIDIPKSLAAYLKASVGGRSSGFLFQSESGQPLTQRNVSRDGLGKIQKDMRLERGKAFQALGLGSVPYFPIYYLRATFASRLSAVGLPDTFVAQMIRHFSNDILPSHAEATDELRRDAIRQLGEMRKTMVPRIGRRVVARQAADLARCARHSPELDSYL